MSPTASQTETTLSEQVRTILNEFRVHDMPDSDKRQIGYLIEAHEKADAEQRKEWAKRLRRAAIDEAGTWRGHLRIESIISELEAESVADGGAEK